MQASPSFCFMPPDSRPGQAVGERPRRGHLHQPGITRPAARRGGDAVQIGVEVEVFLDGQVLVQPESLRHVTDAGLHALRIDGHVDAQYLQLAGGGGQQAGSQPNERGLAGAVGPDQSGERAAAG